ncbi:MAG: hypothetical protein JOZ17_05390 [Acetobacteraceae bacterium]|nr:hypothetical protein [Acetobacteraceae bacterium]
MARAVRSGHILVNGTGRHFLGAPFGGMHTSGVGREEGARSSTATPNAKRSTSCSESSREPPATNARGGGR